VRHTSVLLVLAAALGACGNTTADDGGPQAEDQHNAMLFVERGASEETTARVGARFVQYAGLEPGALPGLVDMPAVPDAVPGCRVHTERAVDVTGGRAEVRLADVGSIEVRADDRVLQLEPRRWPEQFNVSGMSYDAEGDLPAGAWHFRVTGSTELRLPPFDVEARAPEDLAGVTVADQAFVAGAAVVVPRRAFAVRWTRGERDDDVVLTIDGGVTASGTLVCTARDEGAMELDASWAERAADLARGGATVVVHRVRSRAFSAPPYDTAHVVFDWWLRGRARAE
jgi:hypothetical protein